MTGMEQIVPNITKNIVFKLDLGVNGKYNQDLHKRHMLVEIGGIGKDEAGLKRTSAVLAKAVSRMLLSEDLTRN